jgi:hypothetical protein
LKDDVQGNEARKQCETMAAKIEEFEEAMIAAIVRFHQMEREGIA